MISCSSMCRFTAALLTLVALSVQPAHSQLPIGRKPLPNKSAPPAESRGWLTGTALQQQFAKPVNIVWSGNPLRQAITGLSRAQRVAVLIDRRVDPEQRLELQLTAVPLAEALREIAKSRQLGVSILGPVSYFGPADAAARLRTVAAIGEEKVRGLGPDAARKLLQAKPLAWEDLATPRDLLAQIAKEGGIQLTGLELVPHDLWAAADLPPLPLVDRVTLIANQFDLTFEPDADGSQLRLAPVPERVALSRSYPGGGNAAATAKGFAALAPEAQIKVANDKIWVRGLLEDHERIVALRRPSSPPAKPAAASKGIVRIGRLDVRNKPVKEVLEALAERLNFELRVDREAIEKAGISLDQRVTVQLDSATLDDVLRELLKDTGLTYNVRGKVVEVKPR
jgi:hypothetical protein